MTLTLSQIQALTAGTVSIAQEESGIHFYRHSATQMETYEKEARCFYKRACHTAGVRIDFHTDSESMTVSTGEPGKYEVLINGLTDFFQNFETPDTFTVHLGKGSKRVTIVLPSQTPGVIRSVTLDDGAAVEPHTYSKKILFCGDSITQGFDSDKDSQSYAWLVTRYFDADSLNLGVGGVNFFPHTVEDLGYDPDIVLIALGTNDYSSGMTIHEIRTHCAEYLDRICGIYAEKKLFFITPIWRADGSDLTPAGTLADVRAVVAEEASLRNITVIDGYGMVPHRTEYFKDGFLHPNDMGFALYAQNLIKELNRYL